MRSKRISCLRAARSISLKGLLRLKKTLPAEEPPRVDNKPKAMEDDGAWGCLHMFAIECIVRNASEAFPGDFRKILFSASLLNKHWKSAIDNIVDKLDLGMKTMEKLDSRVHWPECMERLLKRFSKVQTLRLTSIEGAALAHLRHYTHVKDVELYAVDFSSLKTVKALAGLRFLRGLKFRNSPSLDDRALKAVACCSNLDHLDLTGCSLITGKGIRSIASITSLVHLYLGDCSALSVEGLHTLSSLSHLQTLNLSGVHNVGNSVLHILSELPSLTDLDIFMCPNVTDTGLWYLAKNVYLKSLNLFSCDKITDEGLRAISYQTSLEKLNLGWCCLLTDSGIRHLSELDNLCELRLSWVPITLSGLMHLTGCISLSLLDIRGCDINPMALSQGIATLRSATSDKHFTVLHS